MMLLRRGWRRQGGEVGFRLREDRDLGCFRPTMFFSDSFSDLLRFSL